MKKTVTLSDGLPCEVRQLGLFELDEAGGELLPPFRYQILLASGIIVEDEYDLARLTEIPYPPDEKKFTKDSLEWQQQQREYDTYTAALAHEKKRYESYEDYINLIAKYVIDNCLNSDDKIRLITPGDFQTVYAIALVPQLDAEGLARCLRQTFQSLISEYGGTRRIMV